MRTKPIYILIIYLLSLSPASYGYSAPDKRPFTLVIDPGHGGHDPGALGRRGKEKNINLNVALKLGKLIEANQKDTKVIYTRDKDRFVPLHERAEIANKAKADLFISIHTNSIASRSSHVRGTETYTLGLHRTQENLEVAKKENAVILIEEDYQTQYAGFNPNSAESYIIFEFLQDQNMSQSVQLAQLIQKQFKSHAQRTDKGVHQAGFLVLRETSMPSVLIELGYITNPSEEAYLLSDNGSQTLAQSIYQAFLSYKDPTRTAKIEKTYPVATTQEVTSKTQAASSTVAAKKNTAPEKTASNKPVFKIQILVSDRKLPARHREFKGLTGTSYYKEKNLYKYTYGESTDYNAIYRLLKSKVSPRFKGAFIIAFKQGKKINTNEAIREFKNKK